MLRIAEPYVFQEVKRIWYKATCRKNVQLKKVKYQQQSLDTFLNSSMNLELVASILIGIEAKLKAIKSIRYSAEMSSINSNQ